MGVPPGATGAVRKPMTSERSLLLEWAQRDAIAHGRLSEALALVGITPAAAQWRQFLDRLLLWSGAALLGAAVIFFVAYNWTHFGRFAKFALVEVLMAAALAIYWRFGVDRPPAKAGLLVAALLMGALLALFGQTYQTGADTWELFATWAVLVLPWVLVGRFAALWLLWLVLVNTMAVLYFQTFHGVLGIVLHTDKQLLALAALDTAALVAWELGAARWSWLRSRWAIRIVAVAAGSAITLLMLYAIVEWQHASAAALIAYIAWIAIAYRVYRRWIPDLLVLAGLCFSLIVVITAFLATHLLDHAEAIGFLFIGVVVIGLSAGAAAWLRRVGMEQR